MTGLVLEGGTLRGLFSAGAMDTFLENGIEFPYIIGVSAGIANAVSYVSKQFGRTLEYLQKYRNDPRYMSMRNLVKEGAYFGLDFAFDTIPNELVPFDYDQFSQYSGTLLAGVTSAETGKMVYLNELTDTKTWEILRASCALPGYFPAIKIDGKEYYDGGLRCPIPYAKAVRDGCEKLVIILTNPEGYVRKLKLSYVAMAKLLKYRYPALEEAFLTRYKVYNRQIEHIEHLEAIGKAIVLRPAYTLKSFEKDEDKMREVWQMGRDIAREKLPQIQEFLL
ncbi:MAG: patatin family protein [Ruminococcus sp.]|jgi:predicted patatin/cPLA2 family phospholipase|nr:patatin family protein [Ruminococcus sp.]